MSDLISLELVDKDGAVREAAEAAGMSRQQLLRRGGVAAGSFVAGGVLFSGFASPAAMAAISRKRSKKNDVRILNYALTLEFLEAEFYKQANASGALTDPLVKRFAEVTGRHEAEHVTTLRKVLGKAAVKKPSFDFGEAVTNQDTFKATAQAVEDLGVSAYAGQGPNVLQKPVVVAALAIHSVEARHAAWIRFINSGGLGEEKNLPSPAAFDKARTERQVLKIVGDTGFIQ